MTTSTSAVAVLATRFRKGDYIKFTSGKLIKAGRVDKVQGDFVDVILADDSIAELAKSQCYKATAAEYNKLSAEAAPIVELEDEDYDDEDMDDMDESDEDEGEGTNGKVKKKYVAIYKDLSGERHCNDGVAQSLKDLEIEDVYAIAAETLDVTVQELVAKYGHLNNGMQRMNLGNRMRAAAKKAAEAESSKD